MAEARANRSHIFYTDALMQRPARRTDYLREKQAMQDLAAQMADHPEKVLPRFVDLAMELTGGVAAGLSLYEKDPMPGVFRWRYLRGSLAQFEGATTPRDFSSCGITLDEKRPILSRNAELVYDGGAKMVVPEVMLVPLTISGQELLGTLWIVADEAGHFDSGHVRLIAELASFVGIALRIHRTEQSLHAALEEQELLTREMGHRLKNVFALTEGLLRISARAAQTKEELVRVMSGRIQALASAHALVRRDFNEVGPASRASSLEAVIRAVMQPHDQLDRGVSRFTIMGADMLCSEHALNGVALVFHELATNAAKYGALKTPQGRIDIGWKLEGDRIALSWIERGGPRLTDGPDRTGFGTKLLQDTVTRQFGGAISQDWKPEGLVLAITLPAAALKR
jgi:two-component sensor histidine kinase